MCAAYRVITSSVPLVFCMIVFGCGGTPSASDAERAFKSNLDEGREVRLALREFKKVDGREAEIMGTKIYTLMFEAAAEFVTDAMYSIGAPLINQGSKIMTAEYKEESASFDWNDFFAASQGYRHARAGDRLVLNGQVDFEKRESGWVAINVQFQFAQDSSARRQTGTTGGSAQNSEVPTPQATSSKELAADQSSRVCTGASHRAVVAIEEGGTDTFVGSVYNKEGAPDSETLSFGGWGDSYVDYLRFDLTAQQRTVNTAYLCLYVTGLPPNDPALKLGQVLDRWSPASLTYASQPRWIENAAVGRMKDGWNAIDITQEVNAWIQSPENNHGLVLLPYETQRSNGQFASAEYPQKNLRPRVVID